MSVVTSTIDELQKKIDEAVAPPMSQEDAKAVLEEIVSTLESQIEALDSEIESQDEDSDEEDEDEE